MMRSRNSRSSISRGSSAANGLTGALYALVLCLALSASFGGCAAATAGGPGSGLGKPVIGIDLGTTYSVVGVWQNGGVDIIPNEMGNRITPSVVAFTDMERLIGDGAKNQIHQNPANTINMIKRIIGRQYTDPTVVADKKLLGYEVVRGKNGEAKVNVTFKGEAREYSAEEVSAMVLGKMKQIAEDYLGTTVEHAVVTVPAYFDNAQREATRDAGTIAGLNVLRVLNEPTAAALAYGLDKKVRSAGEANVLVFDLGGGTFDVSVLQVDDGFFEVLSTNGDTHLGGEDLDNRMVEHVAKVVERKHGVDVRKNPGAVARLRQACESAKRQLSSETEARIEVEGLMEGVSVSEKMTRAKFEELNNDLLKGTLRPVKAALEDAGLDKSAIDEVVLVGGSTRIPKIRRLIKEFFNGKEPHTGINVDESVAYGAAVQGAVLSGASDVHALVTDVTPLSLGIETAGGVMTNVVDRGTGVPVSKTRTFSTHHDQQTGVSIQVFEGERSLTKNNHLLGRFELSGIPAAPRGVPQIDVTFSVDEGGMLQVRAEDRASKSANDITVENANGRLSPADIQRMVDEAAELAEEDKVVRDDIDARNALESAAYSWKLQINDEDKLAGKLLPEEAHGIAAAVADALAWLDENASPDADASKQKLDQFNAITHPIAAKYYSQRSGADEDDEL